MQRIPDRTCSAAGSCGQEQPDHAMTWSDDSTPGGRPLAAVRRWVQTRNRTTRTRIIRSQRHCGRSGTRLRAGGLEQGLVAVGSFCGGSWDAWGSNAGGCTLRRPIASSARQCHGQAAGPASNTSSPAPGCEPARFQHRDDLAWPSPRCDGCSLAAQSGVAAYLARLPPDSDIPCPGPGLRA
jgi:hypothetical protein